MVCKVLSHLLQQYPASCLSYDWITCGGSEMIYSWLYGCTGYTLKVKLALCILVTLVTMELHFLWLLMVMVQVCLTFGAVFAEVT